MGQKRINDRFASGTKKDFVPKATISTTKRMGIKPVKSPTLPKIQHKDYWSWRDGETIASEAAPWVGAEMEWRKSLLPAPSDEVSTQPKYAYQFNGKDTDLNLNMTVEDYDYKRDTVVDSLKLTQDELQTVLSTLPLYSKDKKQFPFIQFVVVVSILFVVGPVAWTGYSLYELEDVNNTATQQLNVNSQQMLTEDSIKTSSIEQNVHKLPLLIIEASNSIEKIGASVDDDTEAIGLSNEVVEKIKEKKRSKFLKDKSQKDPFGKLEVTDEVVGIELVNAPENVPMLITEKKTVDAEAKAEAESILQLSELSKPKSKLSKEEIGNLEKTLSPGDLYQPKATEKRVAIEKMELPSKSVVKRVMTMFSDNIKRQCQALEDKDKIVVSAVISGDTGRIISSSAMGDYQGTSTAKCVARAIQAAKFPKFTKDKFTVRFPYRLN